MGKKVFVRPGQAKANYQLKQRRLLVSALRLRGLSLQEIADKLAEQGIYSPNRFKKGEPLSVAAISYDLKVIAKEWRAEMLENIDELKARKLAEFREVKKAAWSSKNYMSVLRALENECKILGLYEKDNSINATIYSVSNNHHMNLDLSDLSDEELRMLESIAAKTLQKHEEQGQEVYEVQKPQEIPQEEQV